MTLLLVLTFVISTLALTCTKQHECASVSQNYNYVACTSGKCICRDDLGFDGNATLQFKCQCLAPSSVYWSNSDPYCISYRDAVLYKAIAENNAILVESINVLYKSLIWPQPQAIMGALIYGVPSPVDYLFALNSKGRVDPVGTFATREGLIEYFYGAVWTGSARVRNVIFDKLVVTNQTVAVSVDILFDQYDQTQTNIAFSYNLTQSGTFMFDVNNQIKSVDVVIHNLGAAPHFPIDAATQCYIIMNQAGCNSTYDPEGYYVDFADCVNHFANIYRVGSWDNVYFDGNTSTCRLYHSILAIARPQMHCSHAGKTGGHKCVTHEYSSYYETSY